MQASSSLKFDSIWARRAMRKYFDPVERATSDLLSRGGVGTPQKSRAFTTCASNFNELLVPFCLVLLTVEATRPSKGNVLSA